MAREKMVEGRLPKCFEVVSLKEQTFVVNDSVELKGTGPWGCHIICLY